MGRVAYVSFVKLFSFREIQRGVQRNPFGSLSAARQGGLGAQLPVSKGGRVGTRDTFDTPQSFWNESADDLKARIDAEYVRQDGASVGPQDWLAWGDWVCTKSLDIVLPSCYKHDVALASLQKFAGTSPGVVDSDEIDEAWNIRNKVLADAKMYADIAEFDCHRDPAYEDFVYTEPNQLLCLGTAGFVAGVYHWGVADFNDKNWPVTEEDVDHTGGPREELDPLATSAKYSFIICSPPVPHVTNFTLTQTAAQTYRFSWDYELGCVKDITIATFEVCSVIHMGGSRYAQWTCAKGLPPTTRHYDRTLSGLYGFKGQTATVEIRIIPNNKIDFGGNHYSQLWIDTPVNQR